MPDIHILVNTIHAPSILNSSASASWLPICLPRFNPSAFVNAYVPFIGRNDDSGSITPSPSPSTTESSRGDADEVFQEGHEGGPDVVETSSLRPPSTSQPASPHKIPVEIGLVCVSGQADFEAVRSWCSSITEVCCLLLQLLNCL